MLEMSMGYHCRCQKASLAVLFVPGTVLLPTPFLPWAIPIASFLLFPPASGTGTSCAGMTRQQVVPLSTISISPG